MLLKVFGVGVVLKKSYVLKKMTIHKGVTMSFKSFFSNIRGFLMNFFSSRITEQITGIKTNITQEMLNAIELWESIKTKTAPWNEKTPSCGVLDVISGMLADPIIEEINVSSENEVLNNIIQNLNEDNYKIIQNIVSLGSCVLRPVFSNAKLQYELIPLGNYFPTEYDFDGTLTGALLLKQIVESKHKYILVEKHSYKNKQHDVCSTLYRNDFGSLHECSLTECSQTAEITPQYSWSNVERPFIVEFRNRDINKIDNSNVPVSIIAGNENLIKDADEQYARIVWEQEAGKKRVFADSDLFRTRQGPNGEKEVVKKAPDNLFVKFNGSIDSVNKIQTYSPDLRTDAQLTAFNEILRRIELATNIGKGTLSDMENATQTATQYNGGKKAFYSKVDTLESELEQKYKHAIYIFAYMGSAYKLCPFNDEIKISYNDSSRKDPLQEKQIAIQEVSSGIMGKDEYRVKFYGETEEEAKAKVPEVATTSDVSFLGL